VIASPGTNPRQRCGFVPETATKLDRHLDEPAREFRRIVDLRTPPRARLLAAEAVAGTVGQVAPPLG